MRSRAKEEAKHSAEKEVIKLDDVEQAILRNVVKGVQKPIEQEVDLELKYKGKYMKRRALVDQLLLKNEKRHVSHAQQKWRWVGDQGAFENENLQDWFTVHD